MDIDDAGIESIEGAVTESDELIENGDESEALAPRRDAIDASVVTTSKAGASAAGSCGPRQRAVWQQVVGG